MWVTLLSGLAGAVVAPFVLRWRRGAGLLVVFPAALVVAVLATGGEDAAYAAPWIPELGLELALRMDGLARLFCLVVGVVACAVVLYAPAYLEANPRRGRFCALLLLFQSAMVGLVLADNLLLLFCFWEATSVVSYLLVGFDSEEKEARDSAKRALLVTGLGGLALLAGLILLGDAAGTFRISELAGRADRVLADPRLSPIVVLVLLGAFTKSAQVPFHFWLPGAMTAPTPASAFLHAATMVKAGIYLLLRLSPTLGESGLWSGTLVVVGGLTAVYGGLLAPAQRYLKRLLACTTLSALGTLVLLVGIGTELALQAALGFLVAHALYKGALFLVAGTITHGTGEKGFDRLGGLAGPMRWSAGAALLGALAMAGLPPTLGFVAKESLFRAALRGEAWPLLATGLAVVAAAGVVAAGIVLFHRAFLGSSRGAAEHAHEGSFALVAGPLALAGLAAVLGLGVRPFDARFLAPALETLRPGAGLEGLALWHGVDAALGLEGLAIALGVVLALARGRLVALGSTLAPLAALGPARIHDAAVAGLLRVGGVASLVSGRHLRGALITVVVGALVLLTGHLVRAAPSLNQAVGPVPRVYELGAVALVLAGGALAATSRTRLATVAALGALGYGIALLFTFFGAPDLAMTQFVVETLAVVLFVLAFRNLPTFRPAPGRAVRVLDATIAVAFGLAMAALVLLALEHELAPPGSDFYFEHAADAHARNVVNAILSDFRALDTLGEITVLGVAGVGIAALFKRTKRSEAE